VAIHGPPPQPYDPLDRRVAIARRKTGVFRRPMAPRDDASVKARRAPRFRFLGAARGNVWVGLEDSLYIGKGKLVASNSEQVLKIRRILEELGHEIVAPAEARKMLALKGGDRVGFYWSKPDQVDRLRPSPHTRRERLNVANRRRAVIGDRDG
jgi:hypothetical protein